MFKGVELASGDRLPILHVDEVARGQELPYLGIVQVVDLDELPLRRAIRRAGLREQGRVSQHAHTRTHARGEYLVGEVG
jgi:hypothetical protein